MNNNFFIRAFALITLFTNFNTQHIYATQIARGNNPAEPFGFLSSVTTKAFHKKSGTFFVGLDSSATQTSGAYAVSKAPRPVRPAGPYFMPLASSAASTMGITDKNITHLAIAESSIQTAYTLAFVATADNTTLGTAVTALSQDGAIINTSATLNLSDGVTPAAGIVNLTADDSTIFVLLQEDVSSMPTSISGLAQVTISKDQNGRMISDTGLITRDATTGSTGNKSLLFDETITEIKGTSGGSDAVFLSANDTNKAAMYWDERLGRVYIGLRLQPGAVMNDIAKAIVIAYEDTGIKLQAITPDGAISAGSTEIIVARSPMAGSMLPIRALNLGVMHASTGPSYLIVNGGDANGGVGGNTIYALPLVDKPTDTLIHGTLAAKNQPLMDFKFTVAATNPGELPINTDPAAQVGNGELPIADTENPLDMIVAGDTVYVAITSTSNPESNGVFFSRALFAQDGRIAWWSPWTKRAVPFNAFPTITASSSQPEHDGSIRFVDVDLKTGNLWVVEGTTGLLVGLTNWTHPINITCAKNLRPESLPAQLNKLLPTGVYSARDFDQSTPGFFTGASMNPPGTFANPTPNRYALFGGIDQVVFARTSEATNPVTPTLNNLQTVVSDFTLPENIKVTQLEPGAGCVQALEYARTTINLSLISHRNYFFAGTENGLYVFENNNVISGFEGFNANQLQELNTGLFVSGGWKKIPNIPGSVIDIQSSGLALYILTTQRVIDKNGNPAIATSTISPVISTLYKVEFGPTSITSTGLFANPKIIAQTGVAPFINTGVFPFKNVRQFYGIQVISTGAFNTPTQADQIILATNQGLYKSNAPQDMLDTNNASGLANVMVIDSGYTATGANWNLIDTTGTTFFPGIAGADTPIRSTVWPFSIQDLAGCKTYNRGAIHQLSGTGFYPTMFMMPATAHDTIPDSDGLMRIANQFIPDPFTIEPISNTGLSTACLQELQTFDPITFYQSDGARRFFIFNTFNNRTQIPGGSKMGIMPFANLDWNIASPNSIKDPVLNQVIRFYWIAQIGATGYLLAGTDTGVVALE